MTYDLTEDETRRIIRRRRDRAETLVDDVPVLYEVRAPWYSYRRALQTRWIYCMEKQARRIVRYYTELLERGVAAGSGDEVLVDVLESLRLLHGCKMKLKDGFTLRSQKILLRQVVRTYEIREGTCYAAQGFYDLMCVCHVANPSSSYDRESISTNGNR